MSTILHATNPGIHHFVITHNANLLHNLFLQNSVERFAVMNELQLVRILHTVRVSFSMVKTGLPARINFELVSPVNHFGAQF